MISKITFISTLEKIKETSDWITNLYKDFKIDLIDAPLCYDEGATILDEIFNTDLVSYWCWECDFGRDMNCNIYDTEGNLIIAICSEEELYDYLVEHNEK